MPAPAPGNSNSQSRSTGAPQKLHSNIAALREDREAAERARTAGERIADAVTAFAGSMYSVGFHLLLWRLADLQLRLPAGRAFRSVSLRDACDDGIGRGDLRIARTSASA